MHKHFYLYLLLLSLVVAHCTPAKKELKKGEYKTVVTLMKNDPFPTEIHAIEHYNSKGKIIERIRFLPFTPVVIGFEQYFYDSQNNMIYYQRRNSPNFWIAAIEINKYDQLKNLSKRILVLYNDKLNVINEYFPNGKLKNVHTHSNLENFWCGDKYFYYNNQDSLIRVEGINAMDSNRNSRDSIVYGKNRKTTYSIDAENVRTDKYVVIYRKGKIVQEYNYSFDYLSDENEFYLDEVKSYYYKGDLLVKKIEKHSPTNAWCGTGNYGHTETFTYFYE